ncbi:MAG: YihY/virulence factor BrkB family protein [Vicinamibacterales bacterium]
MLAFFRAPLPWAVLAKRTVDETFEDGCPGLAAQLAFYFLLAVFPAMLFLVALLSYLPIEGMLDATLDRFAAVLPQEALRIIREQLQRLATDRSGGLITFAIVGAIWSSSSAMTAVITALNRAFDIEEWRPWWKVRLIAVALTIALAAFVVVALVMVIGGADLGTWLAEQAGFGAAFRLTLAVVAWPIAILLVIVGIDLVYYLAPNADTRWVWLTPGSVLATGLWLVASYGFKVYVETFGDYSAVYGAIGGVIVLMLWLYVSGFAMLVGAELNAEIDHALPTHDEGEQGPRRRKKIGPMAEEAGS